MSPTTPSRTLVGIAAASLLGGCSSEPPAPASAPSAEPTPAPTTDAGPKAEILSVYYGLDKLLPRVARICPPKAVRQDGVPVTFSTRLQPESVTTEAFVVETATGERVTPSCATLQPAAEPLENRTVLLGGPFGTPDQPPRAVEVVGPLLDARGASLVGLRSEAVTQLAEGPSLVLAERYAPSTPGLAGECPANSKQVVQLVFQGGVTGPDGADLGEPQRTAVSVTLQDGQTIQPIALADDDPDNFVHACLDSDVPATRVAVAAGFFHDPGDDANPATEAEVVVGAP